MSAIPYTAYIFSFLKRNWFHVSIALLVLFALFKKDLSFSINLHSPSNTEKIQKPVKKRVMTDAFTGKNHDQMNIIPGEESSLNSLAQINDEVKIKYLKRFAHVAIDEKDKFQIPASIILASAILHSRAGTADFSINGNNQFRITCGSDWNGQKKYIDSNCIRKYKSAWLSFRDHSKYITSGKFEVLKRLDPKSYKKWAKGLEELHFSNERNLSKQLINIIERYKLYELD